MSSENEKIKNIRDPGEKDFKKTPSICNGLWKICTIRTIN